MIARQGTIFLADVRAVRPGLLPRSELLVHQISFLRIKLIARGKRVRVPPSPQSRELLQNRSEVRLEFQLFLLRRWKRLWELRVPQQGQATKTDR